MVEIFLLKHIYKSHFAYYNMSSKIDLYKGKKIGIYTLGSVIAEGSAGSVHNIDQPDAFKGYVLKRILNNSESAKVREFQKYGIPQDILKEIDVYTRVHHPNVMSMTDFIITKEDMCLILPAASDNLRDYLSDNRNLPWKTLKGFALQILTGLSALHKHKIVHLDIKQENILVFLHESNNSIQMRVADMGMSYIMSRDGDSKDTGRGRGLLGTPGLVPPESAQPEYLISYKFDIWSAGCLLYEIMTNLDIETKVEGQNIFSSERDRFALIRQAVSMELTRAESKINNNTIEKKQESNEFKLFSSLIQEMLEPDLDKRATLDFCLNHDFFRNVKLSLEVKMYKSIDYQPHRLAANNNQDLDISSMLKSNLYDMYITERKSLLIRALTLSSFQLIGPEVYFTSVSIMDQFIHTLLVKTTNHNNISKLKSILRLYFATCLRIAVKLHVPATFDSYMTQPSLNELLYWTGQFPNVYIDIFYNQKDGSKKSLAKSIEEAQSGSRDGDGDGDNTEKDPGLIMLTHEREIIAASQGLLIQETIYDTLKDQTDVVQIKKAWLMTLIAPYKKGDMISEISEEVFREWFPISKDYREQRLDYLSYGIPKRFNAEKLVSIQKGTDNDSFYGIVVRHQPILSQPRNPNSLSDSESDSGSSSDSDSDSEAED
jgi:serine/threonine protein kinase